jgi:hypothetical protein
MNTFFKSMVNDAGILQIRTYDPKKRVAKKSQTLESIIKNGRILPNTVHHSLPKRLSASLITSGYTATYRPEGLLFETDEQPDYAVPFDLMALADHHGKPDSDYTSKLLNGHEQFVFASTKEMLEHYPTSSDALKALNAFRDSHDKQPKTSEHNECVFQRAIAIRPIGIVGTSDEVRAIAAKHGLPRYGKIQEYLEATKQAR